MSAKDITKRETVPLSVSLTNGNYKIQSIKKKSEYILLKMNMKYLIFKQINGIPNQI